VLKKIKIEILKMLVVVEEWLGNPHLCVVLLNKPCNKHLS